MGGDAETGVRLVNALRDYWFYEGHHIEGQRWIANGRQELNESVSSLEQGLNLAKQIGNPKEIAWFMICLAASLSDASSGSKDEYANSLALCEDGIVIFRNIKDKIGLAQGLNALGNIHRNQGQYEIAREVYEECLKLNLETGERRREVMTLSNLAQIEQQLGHYESATQLFSRSLKLAYEIGFTYSVLMQLSTSFPRSFSQADAERAARLIGAGETIMKSMNLRQQPNNLKTAKLSVQTVRNLLGDADYEAAYAEGSKLSLEEAFELALRED